MASIVRCKRICGLITDFGNQDYFIGTMKGVMKGISPDTEVIDIANEIPSYSILPASFVIDKTYRFFPAGTIFLVVVDPGVGTSRQILLIEHGNRYFIAPDNGVLTPILQMQKKKVYTLDKEEFFLIRGYSTFEARDKMAPAAAYLAAGVDPRQMSSPLSKYLLNPEYFPTKSNKGIEARVVYIDKFGNIITNVAEDHLSAALVNARLSHFKVQLAGREITAFHETYAQAGVEPFMLIGSHQNLEIAVNQGSAAFLLEAHIGQEVKVQFY